MAMEKKLKIYQMWSVWAAGLLGILTALEPFLPELSKALPPAWQAYMAVAVIVLRAIKQKPPGPPSSGAGIAAAGLLVLLPGCTQEPPKVPIPTVAQAQCIIDAEAKKTLELDSCGANIEGECATDAIYGRRKAAGQKCFEVSK